MHVSVAYLTTALVVALVPGTGVLYTISTALLAGRRASVWASIAGTIGIVPHLVAALVGLSAVLDASAAAFHTLKLAGVAYLLYLAWGMWHGSDDLGTETTTDERTPMQIVVRGTLINLLNPKLTIFFFAFLPPFVDGDGVAQMAWLGVVFMAVTLVVFLAYGALASVIRERVLDSPTFLRRLRRTFAGAFVAMGARLALEQRG